MPMDWGSRWVALNAWQVACWGVLYFAALYGVGALAMQAVTRWLAARGIGAWLAAADPRPGQIAREVRQSAVSILIFGIGLLLPWALVQWGWSGLDGQASPLKIALEILALGCWNEVHFWLNHRWRRFHGPHHRSVVPTPWSTYSFHPVEALLLGSVMLPPMLVHDFSFWSLAALPLLSVTGNLLGHSNYDFFPHLPDGHWLSLSRRHFRHHARGDGNYGFAMRFMDRWMGTASTR